MKNRWPVVPQPLSFQSVSLSHTSSTERLVLSLFSVRSFVRSAFMHWLIHLFLSVLRLLPVTYSGSKKNSIFKLWTVAGQICVGWLSRGAAVLKRRYMPGQDDQNEESKFQRFKKACLQISREHAYDAADRCFWMIISSCVNYIDKWTNT